MKIHKIGLSIFILASSATTSHAQSVERSVPLTTDVTRVYLNIASELHLTQGEEEYVKITAPEAVLSKVDARVKGKSLYLGREGSWEGDNWRGNDLDMPVRFDVQLKRIDALRVRGSGNAHVGDLVSDRLKIIMYGNGKVITGSIKAQDLDLEMAGSCDFEGGHIASAEMGIEVAGSAKIKIAGVEAGEVKINIAGSGDLNLEELTAAELDTEISGSADINLSGSVSRQELEINGSGDYKAANLVSDYAYIDIRGSGDVEINVQHQLTAEITRGSDLVYHGGPDLEVDVSGQGKYRNAAGSNRD